MSILAAVLVAVASALAVSHFASAAWRWLTARKPRLVTQLHAIEAEAEKLVQPLIEEGKKIVGPVETNLLSGAHKLLTDLNAANNDKGVLQGQVNDLQGQLAAKQAELDTANQNHAEFVAGLSGVIPADQPS